MTIDEILQELRKGVTKQYGEKSIVPRICKLDPTNKANHDFHISHESAPLNQTELTHNHIPRLEKLLDKLVQKEMDYVLGTLQEKCKPVPSDKDIFKSIQDNLESLNRDEYSPNQIIIPRRLSEPLRMRLLQNNDRSLSSDLRNFDIVTLPLNYDFSKVIITSKSVPGSERIIVSDSIFCDYVPDSNGNVLHIDYNLKKSDFDFSMTTNLKLSHIKKDAIRVINL